MFYVHTCSAAEVALTFLLLLVLPLIKEAQNQHGLRHGDYQRYRYLLHEAV